MTPLRLKIAGFRRSVRSASGLLALVAIGALGACTVYEVPSAEAGERVVRKLSAGGETRGYIAYFPSSLGVSQVPGPAAAAPATAGQRPQGGQFARGNGQRAGQFGGARGNGQRAAQGQGQRRFGGGLRQGGQRAGAQGGMGRPPRGGGQFGGGKFGGAGGAAGAAGAAAMAGGAVTVSNPPKAPLKVLIAFHPALGTGSFMEQHTELHNTPGAENFIIVYPDGIKKTWNVGDCCGAAKQMNVDDLGFFDAMLRDLSSIVPIEPKAYVTGYSNGALMVYYLTCKRPDKIAAAAPFAAYLPPNTMQRCPSSRIPFMHMHGDADEGSPYKGGDTPFLGYLPPLTETIDVIAKRNGCSVTLTSNTSMPELDTSCELHQCGSDAETMICIIPGLGHSWPGMSGKPGGKFGPARSELQGSEAVMEFFLRH